MTEQKKRPGQSTELGELRTKRQEIKLNDKELKQIEEQAKLNKKTKAKYIRDKLLYENNQIAKTKPVLTNLATENYIKECNQLARIGNNINQLAYRANRYEPVSSLLNELAEEIKAFKNWRARQIKGGFKNDN